MRFKVFAFFLASFLAAVAVANPARATVSQAQTIDGPSADVVDVDGVAMAEDGSGGIVYRKRSDGRIHIFVARFVGGQWLRSQRVDTGQDFDSSWAQIGAGEGGRLVATWVQEFGAGTDRLFSASLDPGATGFQPPVPIDLDIGEATATYPSLQMNRGGTAYLAYRVMTDNGPNPSLPPGYLNGEIRVARYNGWTWSGLGTTADRNPAAPVATPTAANSPKVGIDVQGNGLIAFQEPDDDFVDRIWARRIFGSSSFGIPLLVSPQTFSGKPLRGAADAFSIAETGFGEGAIAFRQQPGEASALVGAHVFVNTIPEIFDNSAGKFGTARIADGAPKGGLPGAPGAPSIGVASDGSFLTAFSIGNASLAVHGDDGSVSKSERLDDGKSSVTGDPAVTFSDSEAGAAAWKVRRRGSAAGVAIQERGADGVFNSKTVSASAGGPVADLQLGGSGLGDALIGMLQGAPGALQIAAGTVDAPPLDFEVQTPIPFVRKKRVKITWDPALNALSGVKYTVTVDDQEVASNLTRRSAVLKTRSIGDGRSDVKVIAADGSGQETQSASADLKIDRHAPRVRMRARNGSVSIRVVDGPKRKTSGVSARKTTISFGDGKKARGKARIRHRYASGGRHTIVVKTRDRAGNRKTIRRTVG